MRTFEIGEKVIYYNNGYRFSGVISGISKNEIRLIGQTTLLHPKQLRKIKPKGHILGLEYGFKYEPDKPELSDLEKLWNEHGRKEGMRFRWTGWSKDKWFIPYKFIKDNVYGVTELGAFTYFLSNAIKGCSDRWVVYEDPKPEVKKPLRVWIQKHKKSSCGYLWYKPVDRTFTEFQEVFPGSKLLTMEDIERAYRLTRERVFSGTDDFMNAFKNALGFK